MDQRQATEARTNPLTKFIGSFRNSDSTVNLAWVLVIWVAILITRWWTADEIKEEKIAADIKARKEAVRYPSTRATSGRVVSINLIAGSNPPEYKVMMEDPTLPKEADGNIAQVEMVLPENSYTTRIQPGHTYEFLFETNVKSIAEVGMPATVPGPPLLNPDGKPVSSTLPVPASTPAPPDPHRATSPSTTPGKPVLAPNDPPGFKPTAPPPEREIAPPAPAQAEVPQSEAGAVASPTAPSDAPKASE